MENVQQYVYRFVQLDLPVPPPAPPNNTNNTNNTNSTNDTTNNTDNSTNNITDNSTIILPQAQIEADHTT